MKRYVKHFGSDHPWKTHQDLEQQINQHAEENGVYVHHIALERSSAIVTFEHDYGECEAPDLPVMIAFDPGRDITNELQEGKGV